MAYGKIISLGASCQVAYQIRRNVPDQPESYPLDWFGTYNRQTLIAAIADDVSRIGHLENIVVRQDRAGGGRYLKTKDTRFDISMMHQFPGNAPLADSHAAFREKFDFLCARWTDVMMSGQRILFIRMENGAPGDRSGEAALESAMRRRYGQLDFDMLHIYAEEAGRPVTRSATGRFFGVVRKVALWRGDDDSWSAIFASLRDLG